MGQALGFFGLGGFEVGSAGSRCCILGLGIGGLGAGLGLLLGHSRRLGFTIGFSGAGFGGLLGLGGLLCRGDRLLLVSLSLLGLSGGFFGLLGGLVYLGVSLGHPRIGLGNALIGLLNRSGRLLPLVPGKPARACGHQNSCCCG